RERVAGPPGGIRTRSAGSARQSSPVAGECCRRLPALIAYIDRARRTCDLEFYIWSPGGQADDVGAAVNRAAQRGVRCRILVDAIGSKAFLKSELAKNLRQNGVRIGIALPTGLLRLLFVRPDLRLHRKIAVIDEEIGFTGSLNLADPRFFKKEAR